MDLGQATRALNDAGEKMRRAEDYERLALLRIAQVSGEADELDARYAAARQATTDRIRAQLHYANCRTALALAWEESHPAGEVS